MAGKIIIDVERCKGCGLCIVVCAKDGIVISEKSNKNGYFPAEASDTDCTGCAMCAIICPDAAIEVLRDSNIVSINSGRKDKLTLTKEEG
jgi:2-oxoglutarate ferredoxin oxidoreductase subunit delta